MERGVAAEKGDGESAEAWCRRARHGTCAWRADNLTSRSGQGRCPRLISFVFNDSDNLRAVSCDLNGSISTFDFLPSTFHIGSSFYAPPE